MLSVALLFLAPIPAAEAAGNITHDTVPAAVTADDGAKVVRQSWIDSRTLDLTIQSPALGTNNAMVRLLLPQGWQQDSGQSWPTLWLLHGCCDSQDYQAWTHYTDVEQFTADKPVIVVMPTGGAIGMYSNWWNYGLFGVPAWETFHMTELTQIMQRGYGVGNRMSIAGLSMGGYGAVEYAARYPGRFGAAASFSGAVDVLQPGIPYITEANMIAQGFPIWGVLWGDPFAQHNLWVAHDPVDNLSGLLGTRLYIASGNGQNGPLDPNPNIVGGLLETAALSNSQEVAAIFQQAGLTVTTDFYGAGTHSWPYWERDLHDAWPTLAAGMGL